MRVAVNLATKPFADFGPVLRRLRLAMGGLALLAIVFGIALYFLHSQADAARAREHSVDTSIAQINQERQQYQAMMRQPDNAQVLDRVTALNRLIDTKAFSWTLAMEDLEAVLPGGVQVTTLEPIVDKKDAHITVRMRVVGPRDKAVELVQNLEHSRRFMQPRIVGENAESTGNGNQPVEPVSATNRVNFDVLADYNPAVPERNAEKKRTTAQNSEGSAPESAQTVAATRTGSPGRQRTPYTGAPRPTTRPAQPHPAAGGPR